MDIRGFLAQLKGRGVYRVAAIYAAGSWALLQVADVLFPIVGFPDWAITAVLGSAALGFPVALILAWIFEITPEGIVETDATEANFGRLRLSPVRVVELGLLIALVVLVGFLYLDRLTPEEPSIAESGSAAVGGDGRPSVAVMAFENLSNDPDLDYFGDGLAEEILNLLAKLNELNVAARTSSFYFKGRQVDIRDVGSHLGVGHVLEGSVRRSGERVRVTAQLIVVSTGYHIWSETYDRDFKDSFLIQDDIARQVTNRLQVILSEDSRQILDQRPIVDPVAYDYYLRGREYLRGSLSVDGMESAIALFSRAIELDENYAEAYAGLCDSHLGRYRIQRDPEQFGSARHACQQALAFESQALPVYVALGNLYRISGEYGLAEVEFNKALAINPESVDALDGLGQTYSLDNRPQQAEEVFLRAIQLQPNYERGYLSMGTFLFGAGNLEQAIPYFKRIVELMPDNAQAFNNLGAAYALTNHFEQAAQAAERALELDPTPHAYSNLGSYLFFLGRFREAVDMYQKAVEYAPEDFEYWGNLGDAYRFTDDLGELAVPMYTNAIKLASAMLEVNPSDASTLALVAHYYANIGEREQALQYLARANALAPQDMYVYYSSATALCSLGELEQAMTAILKAVELGYPRELTLLDPGLEPLRTLADFAQLANTAE